MRKSAVALLGACMFLFMQAVHGHASLLSSSPEDGASLSEQPQEIVLTFSEAVRLTALSLEHEEGTDHSPETLPADRMERIAVAVPELSSGQYTVAWRALSADGHLVDGTLQFAVEPAP